MASVEMMRAYMDMITSGRFVDAEKYYAQDVKIHVRGRHAAGGDYVGHADYTAAIARLVSAVDSFEVENHDLLVSDDHAVALSVWHVTKGDRSESLNHVIVYHADDELIHEIWIIPEDADRDAALLS